MTKKGNVLWDLVTCLNGATIDFVRTALTLVEALIDCSYLTKQFKKIKSKGRLDAIVISHPHYYTAYVEWAKAFQCPVYVSKEDKQWLCLQLPPSDDQDGSIKFLEGPPGTTQEIIPEVTAIKAGGHFPGSLVLHWKKKLFIADTIVTTPVSLDLLSMSQANDDQSQPSHPIHVLQARIRSLFNGQFQT